MPWVEADCGLDLGQRFGRPARFDQGEGEIRVAPRIIGFESDRCGEFREGVIIPAALTRYVASNLMGKRARPRLRELEVIARLAERIVRRHPEDARPSLIVAAEI